MGISKTRIKRLRERLLGKEQKTLTITEWPIDPIKVDHLTPEEVEQLKDEGRYWATFGREKGHWVFPEEEVLTPEEKAEEERQIRTGQLLKIRTDNLLVNRSGRRIKVV